MEDDLREDGRARGRIVAGCDARAGGPGDAEPGRVSSKWCRTKSWPLQTRT